MMTSRPIESLDDTEFECLRDALKELGLAEPTFSSVAGDWSGRRYYRAYGPALSVLVMIPPRDLSPICEPDHTIDQRSTLGYDASVRRNLYRVDAFACIADLLRSHGVRVPAIHFVAPGSRFAILEDLGAIDLRTCFSMGFDEEAVYRQTLPILSTLSQIEDIPANRKLSIRGQNWQVLDLDFHAQFTEASLFFDHFSQYALGERLSEQHRAEWKHWAQRLIGSLTTGRLVLRDLHSPNIMLTRQARAYDLALIDFQDALFGPALYDTVSLLEDARRELAPRAKRTLLHEAEKLFPEIEDFDRQYAVITLQRSFKILGECVRQKSLGNEGPMQHVPRVKASLDRALGHPELGDFRQWLIGTGLYTNLGL